MLCCNSQNQACIMSHFIWPYVHKASLSLKLVLLLYLKVSFTYILSPANSRSILFQFRLFSFIIEAVLVFTFSFISFSQISFRIVASVNLEQTNVAVSLTVRSANRKITSLTIRGTS